MEPYVPTSATQAKRYARRAARASAPWIRQLARVGYVAIGIVYLLIAVLAVLGIFTSGGQFTGTGGATRTVLYQPFGRVLLGGIAIGMAIYVAWRFAQAVLDVEERGSSPRGLLRRAGLALSGLSYATLAVLALDRMITGTGSVEARKDDWLIAVLDGPWGAVLVGLVGAVVLIVGLAQFRAAYRAGFLNFLTTDSMYAASKHTIAMLGRFGLAARGVVFTMIGGFLLMAAWQIDPSEIRGFGGLFRYLARQPYGYWMLGTVAFGLLSYSVYMLSKVRYRHMIPPSDDEEDAANSEQDDGDAGDEPSAGDEESAEDPHSSNTAATS